MSWLLNELSPIDVNFGAEVYKLISNETPTDTNKTFVSVCLQKLGRGEGEGSLSTLVHGKAVEEKVRG